MAKWSGNKVNPEQINNGNEYTVNDNLSVEAINGIVNNSINAQKNAERALELAEGANEANGTVVKINGEPQGTWDATFSQELYEESANELNLENKEYTFEATTQYGWVRIPLDSGYTLKAGTYILDFKMKVGSDTGVFNKFSFDYGTTSVFNVGTQSSISTSYSNINRTFTLSEDITYNAIWIQVAKIGTYTFKEVFIGKYYTQYSPYNPNRHITNSEAEFLKEEFENGKNLFNADEPIILNSYITSAGIRGYDAGSATIIVEIKPNTDYVVSKKLSNPISANRFVIGTTTIYPTYNMALNSIVKSTDGTETTQLSIRTSSNDKYLVAYIHSNLDTISVEDMLDTVQIEKGSVVTPYQPYNSSSHITNAQADFLKSEFSKTYDLFNNGSLQIGAWLFNMGTYFESDKYISSKDYISVQPDSTIYAYITDSLMQEISSESHGFVFYDTNKNYIGSSTTLYPAKVPSNAYYFKINIAHTEAVTLDACKDIRISSNGKIIWEKDITPVLLWSSGIDTTQEAQNGLTIKSKKGYKYVFAEYQTYKGWNDVNKIVKFKLDYPSNIRLDINDGNNSNNHFFRRLTFVDDTTINISEGVRNGTTDNNVCIIRALYGSNY